MIKILTKRPTLLLAALLMAALADFLLYDISPGSALALFALALTTLLLAKSPAVLRRPPGQLYTALIAILLAAVTLQPTPLSILLLTFFIILLALTARHTRPHTLTHWLIRWLELLFHFFSLLLTDLSLSQRWFSSHPSKKCRPLLTTLRWLLPLFAGLIFLGLFALANPIIADWLSNLYTDLTTLFDWLPEILTPWRITLWLTVLTATYTLLRYRPLTRLRKPTLKPPLPTTPTAHHWILRCLLIFNLVFAVQSALDVIYLYAGFQLPSHMTYATYAHRSAYPLIATALLAGLFVMLTFRPRGPAEKSPTARKLVYLFLAQNLLLLISTLFRLALYVQTYSLTRWRLATILWLLITAAGFLYLLTKIRFQKSNRWLRRTSLWTAAAILIAATFINWPNFIATFNIHHCQELGGTGVPLDIPYLATLGPSALPAMLQALPALPPSEQPQLQTEILQTITTLTLSQQNWRTWTYRNHRTLNQLSSP